MFAWLGLSAAVSVHQTRVVHEAGRVVCIFGMPVGQGSSCMYICCHHKHWVLTDVARTLPGGPARRDCHSGHGKGKVKLAVGRIRMYSRQHNYI